MRHQLVALLLLVTFVPACAGDFQSAWHDTHDRVWIGGAYWANPMEDWRIKDGHIECVKGGPNRNVVLLTHEIDDASKPFEMRVRVGKLGDGRAGGTAGFRLGLRDEIDDYRAAALRGSGLNVGIRSDGMLFIDKIPNLSGGFDSFPREGIELRLKGTPNGEKVDLVLTAHQLNTGNRYFITKASVSSDRVVGPVALVNNHFTPRRGTTRGAVGATARFWFGNWRIGGGGFVEKKGRTFGPILWAMHTLSDSRSTDGFVMKMTAQMPPMGDKDGQDVGLEYKQTDGAWSAPKLEKIDPLSRTATFRVAHWSADRDVPYRLTYVTQSKSGQAKKNVYTGTVRRNPTDRPVVVAGFTGNQDYVFPNHVLVNNVKIHNPDILFFSGDQIYEGVGGYGIIREPAEPSTLNYLRKWYLVGWAFGDLMRDRVTVCLPDDHDVYQGNIWGANGKKMRAGGSPSSDGGYRQPAAMVNAVHRTQCDHHPDPRNPDDAKPILQGITPFYTDMVYGRVSFALIGDRMFKTEPKAVSNWSGRADHLKDPKYDVSKLDKPGLHLLGERQERFLNVWAADWRGADMKCVLSQTIFCNLANYHGANQQFIFADLDSNGWPQAGRRRALEAMRRGAAFHYAGDQHLASIVQHGIDTFNDAGFSFCVPSIAAGYPRSWRPDAEGRPVRNRAPGAPANTGEYRDAFGNYMTVHGIGNPAKMNRKGKLNTAHDKASGHGIVRFDQAKQTITMECWRLLFDASKPKPSDQFPGWPKTIHMSDNDGRKATAHLPVLLVRGAPNPVVQVIDENSKEVIYTRRFKGEMVQPPVFADGVYTIKVGEVGTDRVKVLKGVKPTVSKGQPVVVDVPSP